MTTTEKLITVFEKVFDGELDLSGLTPQSRLKEDLVLNSIGMLYMAMALEDEFDVRFTNDDFAAIHTVADVVERLEKKD